MACGLGACLIASMVSGNSGANSLVRRHATVDARGHPLAVAAKGPIKLFNRQCSTFRGEAFNCSAPPEGNAIPKVLHFMYKTKIESDKQWPNLVWKFAFTAWKTYFPIEDFQYMFWDEGTIVEQFKVHCGDYLELYQSFTSNISRSDLSRYCLLHEYGGIYADLDYEPRENFYSSFLPGRVNLLESPYDHEILQNSLMASPPGQEFWLDLLHHAKSRKQIQDPTSATGPHILDAVAFQFESNKTKHVQEYALREDVSMLPCSKFQRRTHRYALPEEMILDKEKPGCSPLDLENFKTMKGIHWGTLSWRSGKYEGKVDLNQFQNLWAAIHGTSLLMNAQTGSQSR
eukprot:gnl/MRDRNA2_/MRDRNA2_100561_c0_seq1.p1 gnl/MRDRNA2_/MRDRNA2_100561_c0~~gnl/MRDRNA2_/MRDRNA2_100561_c0_seq1.p1  ORF type:complete len:344 (-),score=48.19 gnl/MRDRNA2_/MRDRNA2_100561_c0_seq1:20-1051(-)